MRKRIRRVLSVIGRSDYLFLLLIVLSIYGFFHILIQTSQGAEVTDDSVLFVAAGQNIARGNGFSWLEGDGTPKPITGFPPGYSILLAPFDLLNLDLYSVARWLNAIFFGGLIFIVGNLIFYLTRSIFSAVVGSMLILVSKSVLDMYVWIMADGSFYFIYVTAVYCYIRYLENGKRSLLFVTGILIAFASMFRYIGLSLFPAAVIVLIFYRQFSWKKKIKDLAILCLISLLPFCLLTIRNIYIGGSAYNRSLINIEIQYANLVAYLREAFSWFFPYLDNTSIRLRWQLLIIIALEIGLPIYFMFQVIKKKISIHEKYQRVVFLSPLFLIAAILSYAAVILVTVSHYGQAEAVVTRYFLPIMILSIVLEIVTVYRLVLSLKRLKLWAVISAAAVIGLTLYQGVDLVNSIRLDEPKPSNEDFKRSYPENSKILKSIVHSREIFTNEIYLLYYLAERPSRQIPLLKFGYEGIERDDVQYQMNAYRQAMEDGAVLVLFDWIKWQEATYPTKEELTDGFYKARDIGFGEIYADPTWKDSSLFVSDGANDG